MKNHKDLISCTKIPETTEICFLDDVFHPGMVDDKIYYINLKPYVHDLPFELMIDRFINSEILKEGIVKTDFKQEMLKFMSRYHHEFVEKTSGAQNIDKILSKKIMQHLQVFFTKGTNKQKQKQIQITRRTKKNNNQKIRQSKNKTIKK
jgi:hypothetical protein